MGLIPEFPEGYRVRQKGTWIKPESRAAEKLRVLQPRWSIAQSAMCVENKNNNNPSEV